MAIGSHAEQDEVESILSLLTPTEDFAQFLLIGNVRVIPDRLDRVQLVRRDVGVVADDFLDVLEVASIVVEGNAPFIDDPEVCLAPWETTICRVDHELLVERHRSVATRECEVETPELTNALERMDDQFAREGVEHVMRIDERVHDTGELRWIRNRFACIKTDRRDIVARFDPLVVRMTHRLNSPVRAQLVGSGLFFASCHVAP